MTEVVHNLFLIVGAGFWGFLIVVGLNPELGARLGVWLQSLGSARARRAENDRIVQELLDQTPADTEGEHVGGNLDRFV